MFESIQEVVFNLIENNVSPDEIGNAVYGGILGIGTAVTLFIQFTLFLAILIGSGVLVLAIVMRTPLRPYLVDLLELDTVRSYKRYKAIKKAKRKY